MKMSLLFILFLIGTTFSKGNRPNIGRLSYSYGLSPMLGLRINQNFDPQIFMNHNLRYQYYAEKDLLAGFEVLYGESSFENQLSTWYASHFVFGASFGRKSDFRLDVNLGLGPFWNNLYTAERWVSSFGGSIFIDGAVGYQSGPLGVLIEARIPLHVHIYENFGVSSTPTLGLKGTLEF